MLKIGPHEVLQIGPWECPVHLIVDRRSVPKRLRKMSKLKFSEDRDYYGNASSTGYYASAVGTEACNMHFEQLAQTYSDLAPAHAAAIRGGEEAAAILPRGKRIALNLWRLIGCENWTPVGTTVVVHRRASRTSRADKQRTSFTSELADYCIYSIVHGERLKEAAECVAGRLPFRNQGYGRRVTRYGSKQWLRTVACLFFWAMPQIAAESCLGILTHLKLQSESTTYTIDRLQVR
jgi:hypothetical protein